MESVDDQEDNEMRRRFRSPAGGPPPLSAGIESRDGQERYQRGEMEPPGAPPVAGFWLLSKAGRLGSRVKTSS
jgi:hypothetical protein